MKIILCNICHNPNKAGSFEGSFFWGVSIDPTSYFKKDLSNINLIWRHWFLCNKEMLKSQKNWWKMMKIGNIDRASLYIFWTTWGTSMKISENMWLMIILKVQKSQGFTLSLKDTFFEKPQGGLNCSLWVVSGLISHLGK